MIIFPAIDIMDSRVVRLRQGRAEDCTVYSEDPVSFALGWKRGGAEWLHIVDLRGAFEGSPTEIALAGDIAQATGLPCQLGGGVRSLEDIRAVLCHGLSRVIVGSKAVDSVDFLMDAVDEFGASQIAVGIDAKDGFVAVRGWVEVSQISACELAKRVSSVGVSTIIYTDIATDGMLQGPNLQAMQEMRDAVPDVDLIASGGVSSLDDILALKKIDGLQGVIVGRALFDGIFTLEEALAAARF